MTAASQSSAQRSATASPGARRFRLLVLAAFLTTFPAPAATWTADTQQAPEEIEKEEAATAALRQLLETADSKLASELSTLLLAGADWRQAGLGHDAVLSLAASAGADAALERIVEQGVPVDGIDRNGETALFAAAAAGQRRSLVALLHLGADPDRAVASSRAPSWTPLFVAAAEGHDDIASLLLLRGAEAQRRARVDAKDRHGRTPLFYAALHGQAAMVRLLLDAGADAELQDEAGRSPLDVATMLERKDVAAMFSIPVTPHGPDRSESSKIAGQGMPAPATPRSAPGAER